MRKKGSLLSMETMVPEPGMPAPGPATGGCNRVAQVALVCMPFAVLIQPDLGISLLKATLAQRDIACDVHYLSISLADRIGLSVYGCIAWSVRKLLFGEWFFARELFGREDEQEYPLLKGLRNGSDQATIPGDDVELLRKARNGIGAYLDACLSAVPWDQYQVIGFSTNLQQNLASLALARRIKATWPDKVIVLGGANCDGEMGLELHRQFPFIDYVCRGESEIVFAALVERLLDGAPPPSLPGLIVRGDGGQSVPVGGNALPVSDLDSLPYPDFDDYFQQLDGSSLDIAHCVTLVFESSRGCWYGEKRHCTFCRLNSEEAAFRSKSAGRVLDELGHLTRRYGVNKVIARDKILDLRYLRSLVPQMIERDTDWSILYEAKANLRKDQLRLLKQAGVVSLQPGIESLSTSILKLMRKGCTALHNVQLLKWSSELGLDIMWNFLWGFPGEEPGEYARMAKMVPALVHLEPPKGWGPIQLLRFSPYFDDPERWGITNVRPAASYGFVYPLPEASLRRLAYCFDFDYADGRDPRTYTAPLAEMIQYWQANYCPGALTSLSDGQSLVIHDRRPGASKAIFELSGMEKAAYGYCDQAHSLQGIHRHLCELGYAVNKRALRQRLEGWVEDGLMLRDGDWFLSLAVRADDAAGRISDSRAIRRALAGAIAELGDAARRKRTSD
jgi:ribosomal peptide maturation radical SAM protein 1